MASKFDENVKITYDVDSKGAKIAVEELTTAQGKNAKGVEDQEKAYKSFKTQLREANQELLKASQQFGETSKEAVEAAKKVAELKDEMGFAKDLVDQFNPDQKFKALGAATNIAATAMTGITGAMGLFGDQSKDTEKMLLKVQSAMAFSQALSGLSDLGDQFKTLKTVVATTYASLTTAKTIDTVATEANVAVENQSFFAKTKSAIGNAVLSASTYVVTTSQTLWNAALMANPIVAVATAVVALGVGLFALTKYLINSSAENERSAKANLKLQNQIKSFGVEVDNSNKQLEINNNQTLAMAKASGKSADEIRKLTLELNAQEIAEKKLNTQRAIALYQEAKRAGGGSDATDEQKATLKDAENNLRKQTSTLQESLDKRKSIFRDNAVSIRQEITDANNKEIEAQKKHADELQKQREDASKKKIDDTKKLLQTVADAEKNALRANQDLKDVTDQEKLNRQKVRELEAIELLKKQGADVSNLLVLNAEKYATLQQQIDAKKIEKDKADAQKKIDDQKAFDEKFYNGKKEYNDAVNESEIQSILEHKEALLEIEKNFELRKIENDNGLTSDEKLQRTAEVNAFYRTKEEEEQKKSDEAILEQKNKIEKIKQDRRKGYFEAAKVFAGQNKKLQAGILVAENAVALGSIVQSTYTGVMAAYKKGVAGIPEGVFVATQGIASAISTINATKKALSDLGSGGDAGSAPSMAGGGGGGNTSASPQVAFQNSNENQIANAINNNQNNQPIIKALVVGQEVTDQQNADRISVNSNSF